MYKGIPGGDYMRKFIFPMIFVLVLSYSMYIIVAADEQISDNRDEYALPGEESVRIVSGNALVNDNSIILSDETNDMVERSISENEAIDLDNVFADAVNETVSGNEFADSDNEEINETVSDNTSGLDYDNISSNSVSANEIVSDESEKDDDDSLSENNVKESSLEKSEISKVKIPMSTRVYLNPENLLGKGQIFSDNYNVSNHGSQDILIKIKDIKVFQNSDQDLYSLSEETPNDTYSDQVKVNLDMVWKNKSENVKRILNINDDEINESVIYLEKARYSKDGKFLGLNNASKGVFYFTGTLDENVNFQWENSGARISFEYEIVDDEEEIADFLATSYNKNVNNINEVE